MKDEYDLVILDINIPDTDTIKMVTDMLNLWPQIKILKFSMNMEEEMFAKKYLQLGVKKYVSKNAPAIEILFAVKGVLENKKYISPELAEKFSMKTDGQNADNPFKNLSEREFQIFQYLMQGKFLGNISSILQLNSSTTRTYKGRLFKKLNCKNVMELNSLAKFHNILPGIDKKS